MAKKGILLIEEAGFKPKTSKKELKLGGKKNGSSSKESKK